MAGKYISNLQSRVQVPEQVRMDYERIAGQAWPYSGKGILLVHDDGRVIVLRGGKDVQTAEIKLSLRRKAGSGAASSRSSNIPAGSMWSCRIRQKRYWQDTKRA